MGSIVSFPNRKPPSIKNGPRLYFGGDDFTQKSNRKNKKRLFKRLLIALSLVLTAHFVFFYFIAPLLEFGKNLATRTEVIQIGQKELQNLKNQIQARNKTLPPLLSQENKEQFKTKEAPKNAEYMGAFNQTVPEQTIAGPQRDAPKKGGGEQDQRKAQKAAELQNKKPLNLSNLGLGSKLAPAQQENQNKESRALGPQGPRGPTIPVGRDDPRLKRGQENLLNAIESEYYSFFSRFEEPIVSNWYFLLRTYERKIREEMTEQRVKNEIEIPMTLEFVIDRQGAFHSITMVQSSQIRTLDWATEEAVRKLRSLPNPPPGIFDGGQYFSYRLQFVVHISDTPMLNQSPQLRWY